VSHQTPPPVKHRELSPVARPGKSGES